MTGKTHRLLLRKELRLALQPATIVFELLSLMILIPDYPYLVTFFYATLGIFFICVFGRENHDVVYTALLPVDRASIVRARFTLCIGVEVAMLGTSAIFAPLRPALGLLTNSAGLVPNMAFFGFACFLLGIFNITYFPAYYRNTRKVGLPYTAGAVVYALGMVAVTAAAMIPGSPVNALDGYAQDSLTARAWTLGAGAVLYIVLTWAAMRVSIRRFQLEDIG